MDNTDKLEEAKHALNEWAIWSISTKDRLLGYPIGSPLARLIKPSRGNYRSNIVFEKAILVDSAVAKLPEKIRDAINDYYLLQGTATFKAKQRGISTREHYRRVATGQSFLAKLL